MTKEELLREAATRYPIGTRFTPVHVKMEGYYCIVTNNKFTMSENNVIASLTDEDDIFSSNKKYGNHSWNRWVYHRGVWARIMSKPVETTFNNYETY